MRPTLRPIPARKSQYGIDPDLLTMRGSELPDMTSVQLTDLFPDLPQVIYPGPQGITTVRKATTEALADVDMSMIQAKDSVNILASHHGFTLLGGEAYAEMLRTIRDVVHQRTGATNIRLRAGVGLRFRETEEYIQRFGLDEHFGGTAEGIAGKAVQKMCGAFGSEPSDILVAVGPAVGPCCYAVGDEVARTFVDKDRETGAFLQPEGPGHWKLDLEGVNRHQLIKTGVRDENITVSSLCTSCRKDLFFSVRADREPTGRQIALIGLRPEAKGSDPGG